MECPCKESRWPASVPSFFYRERSGVFSGSEWIRYIWRISEQNIDMYVFFVYCIMEAYMQRRVHTFIAAVAVFPEFTKCISPHARRL